MPVDDDPVVHRQTGGGGEFDVRQYADTDDREVGRQGPSVAEPHAGQASVARRKAVDPGIEQQLDAGVAVRVLVKCG